MSSRHIFKVCLFVHWVSFFFVVFQWIETGADRPWCGNEAGEWWRWGQGWARAPDQISNKSDIAVSLTSLCGSVRVHLSAPLSFQKKGSGYFPFLPIFASHSVTWFIKNPGVFNRSIFFLAHSVFPSQHRQTPPSWQDQHAFERGHHRELPSVTNLDY